MSNNNVSSVPLPPSAENEDSTKNSDSPTVHPLETETMVPPALPKTSQKGVEQAKKRLRAFSIQKKMPTSTLPMVPAKPSGATATVIIGKLAAVKPTLKPPRAFDVESDIKRPPKPPKPQARTSFLAVQKKTLDDIEDMKRKMELVDLGIPLGLICPSSQTAMPTGAMPPLKSLLTPAQLDLIVIEAKQAKAEGKTYKFDYNRILPDYDNPFQRKKDDAKQNTKDGDKHKYMDFNKFDKHKKYHGHSSRNDGYRSGKSYRGDADSYNSRKHSDSRTERKDDKYRRSDAKDLKDDKDKLKDQVISKPSNIIVNSETTGKEKSKGTKGNDVNLNDYLVCDSWSLDTEDKHSSRSPKIQETKLSEKQRKTSSIEPVEKLKKRNSVSSINSVGIKRNILINSPLANTSKVLKKIKLKPVSDSLTSVIDDPIFDIDEDGDMDDYYKAKKTAQNDSFTKSENLYDQFNQNDVSQSSSTDEFNQKMNDDIFLESVINEIKHEDMFEDNFGEEKSFLVQYELSPEISNDKAKASSKKAPRGSVTPEMNDKHRSMQASQRSDYIEVYKSPDSRKSIESDRKSLESGYKSTDALDNLSKATIASLDVWGFVLKICQPLLFRHDKNRCYRQTSGNPKIWFTENPRICSCVEDRCMVYEELEASKMSLVDRVYGCDQIPEGPSLKQRLWYTRENQSLIETPSSHLSTTWEPSDADQPSEPTKPPKATEKSSKSDKVSSPRDDMALDREYQKFMDAVMVADNKKRKSRDPSRSTTPIDVDDKLKAKSKELDKESPELDNSKRKSKKVEKIAKISSEGWSQESDVEDVDNKSANKRKLRKRKHSTSSASSSSDSESDTPSKKKKMAKKKMLKKRKSKLEKKRRLKEKRVKKLKLQHKKKNKLKELKKNLQMKINAEEDDGSERKKSKRDKKDKKKLKKKDRKKRKRTKKSSSSSSSSSSSDSSSSESESEKESKKLKRKRDIDLDKNKTKKRRPSTDSQSDELFDANILRNIKTERLTDEENLHDFSHHRQPMLVPRQEIINVKELQCSLVAIKQEVIEEKSEKKVVPPIVPEATAEDVKEDQSSSQDASEEFGKDDSQASIPQELNKEDPVKSVPEESNLSQSSSQESVSSSKQTYEKDNSHLRPSSQNSNYSFNDVLKSQPQFYGQDDAMAEHPDCDKYSEDANEYEYRQRYGGFEADYDYNNQVVGTSNVSRIETVVNVAGGRGEIKCDWRAGVDGPRHVNTRPSRWGLKPGDANIVLTGNDQDSEQAPLVYPIRSVLDNKTYKIQTISTSRPNAVISPIAGYDEAYADMYGAADRLQYGDCFSEGGSASRAHKPSTAPPHTKTTATRPAVAPATTRLSLDDRIDKVLSISSKVATSTGEEKEQRNTKNERGILLNKEPSIVPQRSSKRVSFADGYKPGQDSDSENPPPKMTRVRRVGCPWPCPASHADHVPLWDALPPPPPPPGSPPPLRLVLPPTHLLRPPPRISLTLPPAPHLIHKFDGIITEPPPVLSFP